MLPIVLICALVGCGGADAPASNASAGASVATEPAAGTPGVTDVAGLKSAIDAGGAIVVDVRTLDEFASGHVPGALHIPLRELPGRLAELEAHRAAPVHLVCAVGGRSGRAAKVLATAGFAQPINVDGGTNAWVAAGYPVE